MDLCMALTGKKDQQLPLIDLPPKVAKKGQTKKNQQPVTTAQRLGSIIKSARDIMRKDKGLNGDLDRLPMFTWIMFLKFLDDMEQMREQKATLAGGKFRPAIEPPYRWRDWAAQGDARCCRRFR